MTENDRASAPVRILYKPWGVIAGVAGGMIAGTVFKRVWRLVRGEDEVPGAIDPARSWTETAFAAALEGAVFGESKRWWTAGRRPASRKRLGPGQPDTARHAGELALLREAAHTWQQPRRAGRC